jgi:transposase
MSYVYLKNKNNGTTYVYESIGHWIKEKQMCVCDRKCVGKLNPVTNEIIFSKKHIEAINQASIISKLGPIPTTETSHGFYGATYLFDAIGKKLDITDDLKRCFPDTYKQILSLAYFLILEDRNPLSRFPKWAATHKHPHEKNIPSQRSSELFASITEDAKERFFALQAVRRIEQEYLAYDTTSISSYSKSLKQVKYGVNKDHDPLPQINLALLFGEQSRLPFYYRKLPGNITDVKTVKNLIADLDILGFGNIKLIMDRGFYSEANINALYQNHIKFLIGTKISLNLVKNELDPIRNTIRTRANYNSQYGLNYHTAVVSWDYHQDLPNKGDTIQGNRRMYLHIYFNEAQAVEDRISFNKMLDELEEELKFGKRNPKHEKQYAKYYDINTTPVRGIQLMPKQEAIDEAEKNYGFFVFMGNSIKDPFEALDIYRSKDLAEKAFGNLKERLNMRTTTVSSDINLEGKLFVQFIALIFLSYVKKEMNNKKMFKNYTMQEVLDELDLIECFEQQGRPLRVGEVTNKQKGLYIDLGIEPPALI